ncbi:hypothetical protein [Algoriphagus aquimarinus]|uniref:hypothetical protein n=1 Tax=Algoriphagus aquimarinus TaxID=237018 RepID=UPI0030DD2583|tara:strand:+ start:56535 stop:56852 length:318 start_codon:yes stop_codon:yes gene_type:complete
MTSKIKLFEYESSSIIIMISIFFNEENHLIFEGTEFGKKKGGTDHVYSYIINPIQISLLAKVLKVKEPQSEKLLVSIRDRFEGKDAYRQFAAFMDENKIEFTKLS